MDPREDIVEPEAALPVEPWIPLARPVTFAGLDPLPPPAPLPEFLLPGVARRDILFDLVGFISLFLVISLVGEMVIATYLHGRLAPQHADEEELNGAIRKAMLFPAVFWRTVLATAMIVSITRMRGLGAASMGLGAGRLWLNVLLGVGAFLVILMAVLVFGMLVHFFFPRLNEKFQENAQLIMDAVPRASPLGFVAASLAIGFYEELIFRGFLMPRLRRATGSWVLAVLITTVLFALLHLGDQAPEALLAITALSLSFSVVTILRHSIVPAIIAHALFDLFMFLQLSFAAGDQWQ
jgi:membrane protease YdiL (CAAX protease family)